MYQELLKNKLNCMCTFDFFNRHTSDGIGTFAFANISDFSVFAFAFAWNDANVWRMFLFYFMMMDVES